MNPAKDPLFYTVINEKTAIAVGMASYLRIEPAVGSIEVGHIHFSPLMQRNRDTAWLAIIDRDWPTIKSVFESWLASDNFDQSGMQIKPLKTQASET